MNRTCSSLITAAQLVSVAVLCGSSLVSAQSRDRTPKTARQIVAPSKPVVTLLDVGPTHVTLSWSSTDDGSLIWYTIFVDGQPVFTLNSTTATFTCAAVLVPTSCDPINQDTAYTFTVRARDVDGNVSPDSDPVFVTTDPADPNDQTAPTRPANITAENTGGFHLVRWDPAID